MIRFDENGIPLGGGSESPRAALEARIRDLEVENRQLRAKVEKMEQDWDLDRQSLEWYYSMGLPVADAQIVEGARTERSISEVMAECEGEFGR